MCGLRDSDNVVTELLATVNVPKGSSELPGLRRNVHLLIKAVEELEEQSELYSTSARECDTDGGEFEELSPSRAECVGVWTRRRVVAQRRL